MRTVNPERYAARRASILAAAAAIFAEHGFDMATTAAICHAASIGSGTLFHYFPDKRAIFYALFADDLDRTREFLDELDRSDPLEALLALVDHRTKDAGDPLVPGLVMAALTQAGRDPEFAELIGRDDALVRATVRELLRAAVADRQIDGSLDLDRAARWVCSMIDALYFQASDPEFDAEAQAAMLRLILRRFLSPQGQAS